MRLRLHHKLFLLLLLLLPSQLGYHFWPEWSFVFGIRVDYLSPVIYLTDLVIIVILALWFLEKKKGFTVNWHIKKPIMLTYAVFVVLNIFFASTWQVNLYKWVRILELFFLFLYTKENFKYIKEKMYLPLVLSSVYTLGFAIGHIVLQRTTGLFLFLGERSFSASTPGIALFDFFGSSFMRPYATFSHPNSLAGYFLVVLVFLVLFIQKNNKKAKLVTALGISSSLVLVVISISQLAWLVLVLTAFAFAFKNKLAAYFKYILIGCFVVSLILLPLSSYLIDTGYSFSESIQERLVLNKNAERLITKKPLFGVGLGNFVNIVKNYPEKSLRLESNTIWSFQPVHNIYLLVFAELGFVGLVLFFVFLAKTLTQSKNSKNTNPYILLIVPILLIGLADHYWLTLVQNMLLFAIVLGIASSASKSNSTS